MYKFICISYSSVDNGGFFKVSIIIRKVIVFVILILLSGAAIPVSAASSPQPDLAAKISPEIEKFMDKMDIPGLAVGIVRDNEIIYAEGFGVEEIGKSDTITAGTKFDMASISKLFTATAIMQLVEKGRIDLNAPVTRYLPYFMLKDNRYKDITIKHLLTHTSGLPAGDSMGWGSP